MVIYNQKHTQLVDLSNGTTIYCKQNTYGKYDVVVKIYDSPPIWLASYPSETSAKNVISNICSRLSKTEVLFQMPNPSRIYENFDIIDKKELSCIAKNCVLTEHAKDRVKARGIVPENIAFLIENSPFAYYNKEFYYIAINDYESFVVAKEYDDNAVVYRIVTFLEKSYSGHTVKEKYERAKNKYESQEHQYKK